MAIFPRNASDALSAAIDMQHAVDELNRTHAFKTNIPIRIGVGMHTGPLIMGMRAIAALGLVAVPLSLAVLKRLVAMVQTVRAGDPFVAANAYRLQAIAWFLLGQQILSLLIGFIGKSVSTPGHPLDLDAGFSPSAWLAVILTFVLARVFAEGARMREDLEGTV